MFVWAIGWGFARGEKFQSQHTMQEKSIRLSVKILPEIILARNLYSKHCNLTHPILYARPASIWCATQFKMALRDAVWVKKARGSLQTCSLRGPVLINYIINHNLKSEHGSLLKIKPTFILKQYWSVVPFVRMHLCYSKVTINWKIDASAFCIFLLA